MLKNDFINCLKDYKKLKDFLINEFSTQWDKVDHFDIENGKIILYYFNNGTSCERTYSWKELENKELFKKIEEDIIF